MLFKYTAINTSGVPQEGNIEAGSADAATEMLQRKGLVVSSITEASGGGLLNLKFHLFDHVGIRDIVILSRQISTLFEAQVSALRVFGLLAEQVDNPTLKTSLEDIVADLEGGSSISNALSRHPKIFSPFYVNMVRSGEESGKLDETFLFMADYLERQYEITSRVRNALIYPAFVISTFIVVMILMLTLVIPRVSAILLDSGQEIPLYTKVVIGLSNGLVMFGPYLLMLLVILGLIAWRFTLTPFGRYFVDDFKLQLPVFGELFQKLYLSRIADNMSTMLSAGITMVKTLEVSAEIVGNQVYESIMREALERVKAGRTVSESLDGYDQIPAVMSQMIKVGEETGSLSRILGTLAKFYRREVNAVVDNVINLIEPAMIVMLGVGVGFLLASVLIPIYNITAGI